MSEWIPVSKRLPKPYTYVLVTCEDKSIQVAYRFRNDWRNYSKIDGEVTAWQPLPKSYYEQEPSELEKYKIALNRACEILERANSQCCELYDEYEDVPHNAYTYEKEEWKEYLLNE